MKNELQDLSPEVKTFALNYVIGDAIGSDEYRETQPMAGLNAVENFFNISGINFTQGVKPEELEMLRELRTWIDAIITDCEDPSYKSEPTQHGYNLATEMYPGCAEYEPVLTRAFEAMWNVGHLPPGYDIELITDALGDSKTID